MFFAGFIIQWQVQKPHKEPELCLAYYALKNECNTKLTVVAGSQSESSPSSGQNVVSDSKIASWGTCKYPSDKCKIKIFVLDMISIRRLKEANFFQKILVSWKATRFNSDLATPNYIYFNLLWLSTILM